MSEQIASELPAGASILAIGLMSGTSQDGVDVALIDTDGEHIAQLGATACRPYSKAERTLLHGATAAAANLTDRTARPDVVAEAERIIDGARAEAVESFLVANGLQRGDGGDRVSRPDAHTPAGTSADPPNRRWPRACGTAWHCRRVRFWCRRCGGRRAGRAAGARLSPARAMLCSTTSCGCTLARRSTSTGGRRQAGRLMKRRSNACWRIFALPPPKSLDRNEFRGFLGETFDGIGVADGAATLTALTAAAVVRIVASLPRASASF